jgi:hypothetical protein
MCGCAHFQYDRRKNVRLGLKKFLTLLKIAAAVGTLSYLISRVGLSTAYESLLNSDVTFLLAGTLVLALQPIIGAVRWMLILNALNAPHTAKQIVRWNYIGVFFGQVLPATVGADAIRIWLAGRGASAWRVPVVSVALDRIVMLIVLAGLLLVGLPYVSQMIDAPWVQYLVPMFAVAGISGVIFLALSDKLPIDYRRRRSLRALQYLAEGVRSLIMKPVALAQVLSVSLLSYLCLMTSVFLFVRAFGAENGYFEIIVLLPPVLVASMLPVSIGGWGTRELAMVAALGLIGTPESSALLSSVWLGICSILIAMPGAFYFINQRLGLDQLNQSGELANAYGTNEND